MAVILRSGKTKLMRAKEAELKMPLKRAIGEAFERTQSLPAVAAELRINERTLYNWMPRLGITVKVTLVGIEDDNGKNGH